MIDLHSHTNASDGRQSPSELVLYAAQKKISILAITDHDTVAAHQEAQKACNEQGITFVPGIEISVDWPQGEFHLLGHGIKNVSDELKNLISNLQEERILRNSKMIEKMRADGIDISLEELSTDSDGNKIKGTIGRPHFADFLVRKNIVHTRQQAFDKYLGSGRLYYERNVGANLDQAISAIKSSGGVPVLAHPLSLYLGWSAMEPLFKDFFAKGIQGIEAWHPGARVGECIRLEELARRLGFFVTAGSDFHGPGVRADRHLGHTAGNKKIEERFFYEELLPHIEWLSA